ncbi:MAG: UTP--glucose-1-phosphate uridylyltransferase [Myxococcales bacterium]|nr:UTP--glucose-1-phosphate uridylyltransferase [Myxococcales bacterium]
MCTVRLAVIPAAGLGTRFLPATKSIPKEMFPIVKRPAIQVIAEEAQGSGITDFVMVTGRTKGAILDHFDRAPELEAVLERDGKVDVLSAVIEPTHLMNMTSTRQHQALGLGHAVLAARPIVGDRPFAVMLPDDLVQGEQPYLRALIDAHEATGKGVVGIMEVRPDEVSSYGIVQATERADGNYDISDMVEKPDPADAPSRLAIVGRYVLPSRVFELLEQTTPGKGGEIQLTDALCALAKEEGMIGVPLSGVRHDTGNVEGYITANVAYALNDPSVGPGLKQRLQQMLGDEDS